MPTVKLTIEWYDIDQKMRTNEIQMESEDIVKHRDHPEILFALIAHRIGRRCKRVKRVHWDEI